MAKMRSYKLKICYKRCCDGAWSWENEFGNLVETNEKFGATNDKHSDKQNGHYLSGGLCTGTCCKRRKICQANRLVTLLGLAEFGNFVTKFLVYHPSAPFPSSRLLSLEISGLRRRMFDLSLNFIYQFII